MPQLKPVIIAAAAYIAMTRHALEGRPDEVCGCLIGRDGEQNRQVLRVAAMANVWPHPAERPHRFAIDPLEQMGVEAGLASGESLLGFYHSHPASLAVPSAFDAKRAWPAYSYVIVSLLADVPVIRCWEWADDAFLEQAVMRTD
ncbi:MAG TPA: M67 family metallopeptidase [Tepidisphaeraceae bacterium]|jgi:proteasome lid subunit RPN8/RPN11